MKFERIGSHGIKITLDSDETSLLYRRLSDGGPSGGKMLIAALLAAAQEECSLSFSSGHLNVEILDAQGGAVIYITEIKPYYYLSDRRNLSAVKKKQKQLICSFADFEKLMRFIRSAACTPFNTPLSALYSNGSDFIVTFSEFQAAETVPLLNEFGVIYRCSAIAIPEEYEMIIESKAVETLRGLLSARSLRPYHQRQTDSSRKL